MGNRHSYDKDPVIRLLWKVLRSIPVLPVNPNLAPLLVVTKQNDGYRDVGSVASLCKPGAGKKWLERVLKSSLFRTLTGSREEYFTTRSIGEQTYTISDDHGARAIAKLLLFGELNAEAWFSSAKSIAVYIPECWVSEFKTGKWGEMLQHFNPDMSNSFMEKPESNGKRKLIIVQKVMLVSHVRITASYKSTAGLNFELPEVVPGGKVQTEVEVHGQETVFFTLSATKKNQKLPIAFSGFEFTYDKFGNREPKQGKPTRNQPDKATSSNEDNIENDGDDEDVDEDTAANDGDMGDFFKLEDDDWCINIISSHDHAEEDDDLAPDPASLAGSPPRDLEESN